MNLINCFGLAEDGTWFSSEENYTTFKTANPSVFTVKVGDTVTVLNKTLLSSGYTGKVIGFSTTKTGKKLLMIKWHKDAAPLCVGIAAVMPHPPRKFWMVIPLNETVANQNTHYDGNTRRHGSAPAVHRFDSLRLAEQYIANERRTTRYQQYVLLEPVRYYAGVTSVSF